MRRLSVACLCVAMLAGRGAAEAGINRWTSNGPYGGCISSVLVDPSNSSILVAGDRFNGALYRSLDAGLTWSQVSTRNQINDVAVFAADPDFVYAAGASGSLIRSSNHGARFYSWSTIPGGPFVGCSSASDPYSCPYSVLSDASDPETIYAGTPNNGVQRSTDGGDSWSSFSAGLASIIPGNTSNKAVPDLGRDSSGALVAGTKAGVFRYDTFQATWREMNGQTAPGGVGPHGTIEHVYITELATGTPAFPMFAATAEGLHRAEPAGDDWYWSYVSLGAFLSSMRTVALDTANQVGYVGGTEGVYRTINLLDSDPSDVSWTLKSTGLGGDVFSLALEPGNNDRVWAGVCGAAGVYRTTNGGATWEPRSQGITSFFFGESQLAIAPTNPSILIAASGVASHGVVKSTDAGLTWTYLDAASGATVNAVAFDPTDSQRFYAGFPNGVARTTDGGVTWQLGSGGAGANVTKIRVAPSDPSVVYALAGTLNLMRSDNGGVDFTPVGTFPSFNSGLVVDPTHPLWLWASTGSHSVLRSVDGGATWSAANTGLPAGDAHDVYQVPQQPDRLYVHAGPSALGTYTSGDGGNTWSLLPVTGCSPYRQDGITSAPTDPSRLYVSCGGAMTFTSGDSGATWERLHPIDLFHSVSPRHPQVAPNDAFLLFGISGSLFSMRVAPGDADADGVPNSVEDGAPNGGDGNGDGIPDSTQDEVASLPNATTGAYVTLQSPAGTRLVSVHCDPPPGGLSGLYPIGTLSFGVSGLAPGQAFPVELFLPWGVEPDAYWKLAPPAAPIPFGFDGTTGAVITGTRVTLHFVDGGRGDDDGVADGQVTDPGAPVRVVVFANGFEGGTTGSWSATP